MGKVVTVEFENEGDAAEFFEFIANSRDRRTMYKRAEIDWHTPHELYEHRYTLWWALMHTTNFRLSAWLSKQHHDGTMFKDSFITGVNLSLTPGQRKDVTYHLPLSWWPKFSDLTQYEKAPEYDGCTPEEGLKRLMEWSTR